MCLGIEAQMPAAIVSERFVTKFLDLSALWIDSEGEPSRARGLQKW
jgi:hypothetical protein